MPNDYLIDNIGENTPSKKHYPEEIKHAAKGMYLRRYAVTEIAKALSVPNRTVYHWVSIGEWDNLLTHESTEEAINRRLTLLIERDGKSNSDLKEMDTLLSTLERLQKLRARELGLKAENSPQTGWRERHDAENPYTGEGTQPKKESGRRGKKVKNDVSKLTKELFEEKFHSRYFAYQRAFQAAKHYRNRMLLKARQIGATWYFAQEAFEDACLTGDNQIFLSATKAQSQIFHTYISKLCGEAFDITLSGNPMILNTAQGKAELHFLSTSSRSAQGYHGHVYMDECFWMPKFDELWKVASAMSAHKKWRRTLFSTPSAINHLAYPKWSGAEYQARFKNIQPWPDKMALRNGIWCPDKIYRQIITLSDAEAGGCDLFDVDELKLEYTSEQFRQLFDCEFIDDTQAIFRMNALESCMEDPDLWTDINPKINHPVGNTGVWGGYDPARSRDDASFVVLLPPVKAGDKIRVIERHKWVEKSYLWQVGQIKELTQKYRFTHMGIDTTGPGQAVLENVQIFCPIATAIHYSVQVKSMLVLKAKEVIEQQRLAWDAAEMDISHAFMTIRQGSTPNGGMTYFAQRSATTGHADVAWAIMHALGAEPLARQYGSTKRSSVAVG